MWESRGREMRNMSASELMEINNLESRSGQGSKFWEPS